MGASVRLEMDKNTDAESTAGTVYYGTVGTFTISMSLKLTIKDETTGKTTNTTLGSNTWTFGSEPYNGNNITLTSSKTTVVIPQGCSVTITASYTRQAFTFRNDDHGDVNYAMYYSGQGYCLASFRCTFSATIYKDTIYADGLLMSQGVRQYLGIDSELRDGCLFRAVTPVDKSDEANNVVKMTSNGLLFSAGSSAFFFLNPIALVVRVKYSSGAYSITELYNPRVLKVGIESTSGGFIIAHNLNHTYYTCYASHWALTANHAERDITFGTPDGVSQPVYIVEGGSAFTLVGNNDYIDVTFIDYRTF